MPAEKTILRVYGESGMPLSETRLLLEALEHAYNSLYALESVLDTLDRLEELRHYWPIPSRLFVPFAFGIPFGLALGPIRGRQVSWPPSVGELASMVTPGDRLLFGGARFDSPGWWQLVGAAHILDVIRCYLNDRHERRKDKDFRNAAERRKFEQEERAREIQLAYLEDCVIFERIKRAKELGATDRELAPLLNDLLHWPVRVLGSYQDRGIIERAEIDKPPVQDEDG
jgi:hypothetical protein